MNKTTDLGQEPFGIRRAAINALVMAATILAALMVSLCSMAQTPEDWEQLKGDINIYLANDLGRNGYYDQKKIAELMGLMAETIGPECVVAAGDIHHFYGIASVDDPLWTTNYELIYSHPELMIQWYPILGNHEYRGNTQAFFDYGLKSRRWISDGGRYYSKVFADDSVSLRIILIDTTPLIDRYRVDGDTYPDAGKQEIEPQMEWLDKTLSEAKEDWVIVVGHHPIYAQTPKLEDERRDMQRVVLPILKRHDNVALYASGHIHNFQHIEMPGDGIKYVVNSSASKGREVEPVEGTVFCSPEPGFAIIAASADSLKLHMINPEGKAIHTISIGH